MGIRLSKRFTKIVCLIIFLVIFFKVYKSIIKTYTAFKKDKEIKSQSIMLPFNIRRDGFYGIKPIYTAPLENKDIVINIRGKEIVLEEVVNSIRKKSEISVTDSAVITTDLTSEEEVTKVEKDNINDKDKNIEEIINSTSDKNKKTEIIKEEQSKKTEIVKKDKDVDNKLSEKSYYIQLGIYKDRKNAEKTASKASEYRVSISEDSVSGQKIYRVSIEGFDSREDAMVAADKLRKVTDGELPIVRLRY